MGRHEGIHRWTVGQRRPGLFEGRKLYVSRIDGASNTVELALWEALFQTELFTRDFNWLIDPPAEPLRATVRVRHTKWEEPPCAVTLEGDRVRIVCDTPVRAPAPGQSAELYAGGEGRGVRGSGGNGIGPLPRLRISHKFFSAGAENFCQSSKLAPSRRERLDRTAPSVYHAINSIAK